jgi:hypothetical protein
LGDNNQNIYLGVTPQQPLVLGGSRDFQFNVESNIFRISKPILVIHSSNNAGPRKKFGHRGPKACLILGGVVIKKTPPKKFPSQNTPFHNF